MHALEMYKLKKLLTMATSIHIVIGWTLYSHRYFLTSASFKE